MRKSQNSNLHNAKVAKNDEFFTQLTDIENEMKYYREYFAGKTVYLNCDDPRESKFFHFFSYQFEFLGLKKLISTGYKADGHGVKYVYTGDKNGNNVPDPEEIEVIELKGTGGFETEECIELLKEADVVVSNPPFSKFREYVSLLVKHGKKFIIIGNKNAIAYADIFPLIKEDKLWLGVTGPNEFTTPNGNLTKKVNGLCRWFTNLEHYRRKEEVIIWKRYNENDYPRYDNYDAINVDKVKDIPIYDVEYIIDNGLSINKGDMYMEVVEEWKDIENYEGYYQVSNFGNVKSVDRVVKNINGPLERKLNGKVMSLKKDRCGYLCVSLTKEGKRKTSLIHRLVAQAFIPNPENKPEVNHIDENKENNLMENLEWVSSEENCNYGTRNERLSSHDFNQNPILQFSKNGKFIGEYKNAHDAARKVFGEDDVDIHSSGIRKCSIGYRKTYKGFIWMKKENPVMGVPITFMDRYNPEQFEILGCYEPELLIDDYKRINRGKTFDSRTVVRNGKITHKTYHRLFIRRRK